MFNVSKLLTKEGIKHCKSMPSQKLSAYRGGGSAELAVFPRTKEELSIVLDCTKSFGLEYAVLGNGSNTLIADGGYHGLLICTKLLDGCSISGDTVTVGSAFTLPKLAVIAAQNSLGGLEALSGIPASVGGAIVMNCGAYGKEIKDILLSLTYMSVADGSTRTVSAQDIPLGYRTSNGYFEDKVILSAEFALTPKDKAEIIATTMHCRDLRLRSQPQEPSLGCAFIKANGVSAGYFIDKARLKGAKIGGAKISEKHAAFIVNAGGGTAGDYLALTELAQAVVYRKYNIELIPEIKVLGGG